MRLNIAILGFFLSFVYVNSVVANERNVLQVTADFIDLHTGPGQGYPRFYSLNRGGKVTLLKQRADWYKVQVKRGKTGWVQVDTLASATQHSQSRRPFSDVNRLRQQKRQWGVETGFGIFGDDPMYLLGLQWRPWSCCGIEARMNKVMGSYTDARLISVGAYVTKELWPRWNLMVAYNVGEMESRPRKTLVRQTIKTSATNNVGMSIKYKHTQRLYVAAGWRFHQVDTQIGDSQFHEWITSAQLFF